MSKGRQAFVGCALGCLILVLLAVGSCVGFTLWLNRPGDVLQPERLLSPETTGYVEWTLRLEDPGTREFFEVILEALEGMNEQMPSFLPPSLDGPLRRMQQRKNEKKLRRMFPIVLVWTIEPAGRDMDDHLLSASLRGLDHQLLLADWILGLVMGHDETARIVRHRNEKIFLIDRKDDKGVLPVFIHHGDLFFTSDQDSARRAVDRLQTPKIAAIHPSLQHGLDRAPTGSLRGALSNRRGEVWRAWGKFFDGEIREKVDLDLRRALEDVTVGGALTSAGSMEARISFHFRNTEDAVLARIPIRSAIADLINDSPLQIVDIEVQGGALHCDLEIVDVSARFPRPARADG